VTAPGLRRVAAGLGAEVTALHYQAAPPARATLVLAHGAGAEMRHAMGVAVFAGMIGVTLFGLVLFAFATLFDFGLIRRSYDARERAAASEPAERISAAA